MPSCHEGAIRIVGGKARLVSDVYCDGLGACLGHCPLGAITIVEREADEFDEVAAMKHAAALSASPVESGAPRQCPGAMAQNLQFNVLGGNPNAASTGQPAGRPARCDSPGSDFPSSRLVNWPVQLRLVPPNAPYLQQADILLVADCVPVVCPDFHQRFVDDRPVIIACPKLDEAAANLEKLTQVIKIAGIRSITVLHVEVPCCTGLVRLCQAAIRATGKKVALDDVVVSVRGNVR